MVEVIITDVGPEFVEAVKLIVKHTGIGIVEAKDLIRYTPAIIKCNSPESATALYSALILNGCDAEVKAGQTSRVGHSVSSYDDYIRERQKSVTERIEKYFEG